jgi:hypothetical protein
MVWVGSNPNKGLAIISFTGSKLSLDVSYRATNQYIAPVQVNPANITGLADPQRSDQDDTYYKQHDE